MAFAAGHLVYIALFLNQGGGLGYDVLRILIQIAVAGAAGGVAHWLWPDLGEMRRPVAAYMVIVASNDVARQASGSAASARASCAGCPPER